MATGRRESKKEHLRRWGEDGGGGFQGGREQSSNRLWGKKLGEGRGREEEAGGKFPDTRLGDGGSS